MNLRKVTATRYMTPLREGGSLPAIVAADDDGTYVLKFRGAGQGPNALIAELIAGELARAVGLRVPEIVFIELDADLAAAILWFDAFVTNVDRTARNTNMLIWHRVLWLIDHGACLYFHHSWEAYLERSIDRFSPIKDHVLLPFASSLEAADQRLSPLLTPQVVRDIVALVPDEWLQGDPTFASADEYRNAYVEYLLRRLQSPHAFVEEAIHARSLV